MAGRFASSQFRRPNQGWKPCYRMQVSGQRAVDLMQRIRPMMGERRRGQIDEAVACWNPISERNRSRNEQIIRLYESGELNYTQIARAVGMGLSRQAVRQVVIRHKARQAGSSSAADTKPL